MGWNFAGESVLCCWNLRLVQDHEHKSSEILAHLVVAVAEVVWINKSSVPAMLFVHKGSLLVPQSDFMFYAL